MSCCRAVSASRARVSSFAIRLLSSAIETAHGTVHLNLAFRLVDPLPNNAVAEMTVLGRQLRVPSWLKKAKRLDVVEAMRLGAGGLRIAIDCGLDTQLERKRQMSDKVYAHPSATPIKLCRMTNLNQSCKGEGEGGNSPPPPRIWQIYLYCYNSDDFAPPTYLICPNRPLIQNPGCSPANAY